ncbi:hypothetical protein [Nocardioides sp. SYSU DS0663]|uniref:hypothetical protein n=1 Tax=Nocardioides sp. SYSU DS0663 TaxID=3416445 RepID=UPI003F4BDE45
MTQRKISEADIESAITNAHTTIGNDSAVTYVGPGVSGEDLKVWTLPPGYVDGTTTVIVKSAAWKNQEDPA